MTPKEYLEQVRRSGQRLATLAARMDWIRSMGTNITGGWSGVRVQGDPSFSRVEGAVVALADMMQDAEAAAADCRDQQRRALEMINALTDERHRSVLELRYISCHQWADIADILSYDGAWVYKLHAEALKTLENSEVWRTYSMV